MASVATSVAISVPWVVALALVKPYDVGVNVLE